MFAYVWEGVCGARHTDVSMKCQMLSVRANIREPNVYLTCT
jgi:hypothetical protein